MKDLLKTLKGFYDPLDSIEIVGGLILLALFGYGLYATVVALLKGLHNERLRLRNQIRKDRIKTG